MTHAARLAPTEAAEQLLDLARAHADHAEVYFEESEYTPVTFESNRLKLLETNQSLGAAVRVIKNGRVGLASASDLSTFDDLRRLVETAVNLSAFGAEARYSLPTQAAYANAQTYDGQVDNLSVARMVEIGQEMIDTVVSYNSAILCSVDVAKFTAGVRLLNSTGLDAAYRTSNVSASIVGNLIRGNDILEIYEGEDVAGFATPGGFVPMRAVERLLAHFRRCERMATSSTADLPAIFTPKGVASVFADALVMALSGKSVLQKMSPLSDKLGQTIFDERLSLVEDPTLPLRTGTRAFDDEGVATRRKALIEHGAVKGFYYDLQTAGLVGVESTGNGYRSLGSLPGPSTSNLILAAPDLPEAQAYAPAVTHADTTRAGWLTFDEMVRDIQEGIVIDQTGGAWASNLMAGDISGNVQLGYKIERGEIVGRIKDTMFAGNIFEALTNIVAIGSEGQWMGNMQLPDLYLAQINFAAHETDEADE